MNSASAPPPVRPPALAEATKKSTSTWQEDLQSLFHRAKDRFPDVVWDLVDEDAMDDTPNEEVWGHKAMVYARAPPTFQARYFSFRPPPVASPLPYAASPTPSLPLPATSALSLNLGVEFPYPASTRSVSPSNFRPTSPAPSVIGSLTRIPLNHNPALFSNELEYLYTGKGFGDAFEFLFDANEKSANGEDEADEARVAKLRKDLVYMWRSRLYSDIIIEIHEDVPTIGALMNNSEEDTAPAFYSHRFILATRSPYFYDQLITYGLKNLPLPGEPAKLKLPSPPFTAPALHFTLGFLYTGTLAFSNRTYDLDTAFAIMCSANYLQLQALYDEIQARIVVEMMHGLFHAFLEFTEYERITGGKWGNGCRCRQCARRAPRVLQFAVRPDVQNVYLDRGARRALVGLFGEGWVTSEFAELPQKTRDGLLSGVKKRCLPMNVLLMLFAAQAGLKKLNTVRDSWADCVKEMILTARSFVDSALCNDAEKVFNEKDWVDIMENDGMGRFEDGERVEWVMESIKRGMNDSNVGKLYQSLISSVLLRPSPKDPTSSLLSSTSQIRVQVEQTRFDILRMIRRRWVSIRQEGGFDSMEQWAIKEIADEIGVPLDDLKSTSTANARGPLTRTGLRPTLSRVEDATERDSMSTAHSLRTSVLNKNITRSGSSQVQSSSASVRSVARSVVSTKSRASSRLTTGTERERKESRPDSKFAMSSRSISPTVNRASSALSNHSAMDVDEDDTPGNSRHVSTATSPTLSSARRASITKSHHPRLSTSNINVKEKDSDAASVLSVHERNVISVQRPKSTVSVSSTRSHASTIRRNNNANAGNSSNHSGAGGQQQQQLRPPPSPARSTSSLSNASLSSNTKDESLSAFRTPRDSLASSARSRKISTASTASNVSMRSGTGTTTNAKSPRGVVAPTLPKVPVRSRRLSEASVSSSTTTGAARNRRISTTSTMAGGGAQKRAGAAGAGSMIRKSPSANSLRTTTGSTASTATATGANRRSVVAPGMAKSASADDKRSVVSSSSMSTSGTKKVVTGTQQQSKGGSTMTNGSPKNKPLPKMPSKESVAVDTERLGNTESSMTIKGGKRRLEATTSTSSGSGSSVKEDGGAKRKSGYVQSPVASDSGSNTTRTTGSTVKRKGSNDTITLSRKVVPGKTKKGSAGSGVVSGESTTAKNGAQIQPRGATLDIGIPCLIYSKRKRFRAFARYIGEVEGESGPWVGVEVPIGGGGGGGGGDSWDEQQQDEDGRPWHDGSWGGIKYFDVGSYTSEWGDDERLSSRRRRNNDLSSSFSSSQRSFKGTKREGDTLSFDRKKRMRSASPSVSDVSGAEYRGLFVRPQQVLYVLDAVGDL